MTTTLILTLHPEVAAALREGRPVVALESTLIAHGLPWPLNLETARAAEEAVRAEGGVPAAVAVRQGRPTVGLTAAEMEELAKPGDIPKASRRDLALAVARRQTAATTVAATMFLAHQAGIRLFATGGIGGAHPGPHWDVSADLVELARTPVAVVCAGAKSILDIPRTLEMLESLGVPTAGYGTGDFPAFYVRSSGRPAGARLDSPEEAAAWLTAHWALGGAGAVLAQPVAADVALEPEAFAAALARAEQAAAAAGVGGAALTPFLLSRLAEITRGQTLAANRALVIANARLAARVAHAVQYLASM
jgi:pseudouridine-5'-phosphate glycosidase